MCLRPFGATVSVTGEPIIGPIGRAFKAPRNWFLQSAADWTYHTGKRSGFAQALGIA
jgi:hypothetical protein